MDLPKPPKDTELRNIIDKLAQFVARNGPEFEHMTKTKQKNNPKFQFLYGGEHFNYYQYKVTTEQAILKQGHKTKQNNNVTQNSITNNVSPWANIPTPSGILTVEQLGQQQNILQEQIRQSEQNLNAQYAVLTQQQQTQIDDTVRRAEEDALQRLATDSEVDLDALDQLLQPIMDSCTKDSISNGKGWILQNATNQDKCEAISKHLMKKIIHGTSTFLQKLHIIYLVNDVLHHCARKHADELKKALEEVVVPMFCSTTVGVTDDQKAKLDKLLSLWESKANYFTAETVQKLHNPSDSYQEYQASLITKHSSAISTLTQNMKTTFEGYQAQHNAFVSHASQQIQVLEQQKQNLEKQNTFLPPSNFQQNNLSSSFPQHQIPQPSPLPGQTNFIPEDTGNSNQSNVSQNSMPSESSQNQSDSNNFNPLSNQTPTNGNLENVNQIFPSVNQTIPPNTIPQNIPGANPINPASLSAILPIDPSLPPPNINISNSGPELALNFNQPPPGFLPPPGIFPDFSKPPPGFPIPPQLPPPVEEIFPSVPYYDLPAGLIVPLIKLEDRSYKPLDASTIRLPPPAPPSDRLLTAVEAFYGPPSHERPRDSDGWEKLGLYEYYRAKNLAKKQKDEQIAAGLRQKSKSPSPIVIKKSDKDQDSKKRRYSSKSPSPRSPVRRRSGSRRDRQRRKRSRSRSRTRSPLPMKRDRSLSPPSSLFLSMSSQAEKEIDETNKGHQLLKKMGWGGSGLGAKGQGIEAPIAGGEIRDRQDMYKGVGVNVNDPYENFRKRKVAAIITRMKARAEERAAEERC